MPSAAESCLRQCFDDIRPYSDAEIPAAMARIAENGSFPLLASFVYPDETVEAVRRKLRSISTIRDFQSDFMADANRQVLRRSVTEFTCNGLEQLSPDEAYVYVSNHRDIVLDSSLLQYYMFNNGFDTAEITFGANLMMNQFVIDIGKSNKMFRTERPGGNIKDFYLRSHHLSQYIRHIVTEERHSVWIAQRNGRSKDGNDKTDEGVVKMLCMSRCPDRVSAVSELHIVPVSVSYEWESCDVLKTLELYESQFTKYTKKPGEDLNSILTGILQQKGRVHIELCRPIGVSELTCLSRLTTKDYYRAVSDIITDRIIDGYRLFPNNYIAYDFRYGCTRFAKTYTPDEKEAFSQRVQELSRYDTCEFEQLADIFLGIYSNPVKNKLRI
ncbi:MAG: acyltransferase [Prevotellaceae bacterium]|nr:acyltransferase [Prevotellaceae bacterium]